MVYPVAIVVASLTGVEGRVSWIRFWRSADGTFVNYSPEFFLPGHKDRPATLCSAATIGVVYIASRRSLGFVAKGQADLFQRVAQAIEVGANGVPQGVWRSMGYADAPHEVAHRFGNGSGIDAS